MSDDVSFKILLFGSRAIGTNRPDSDIDVFIQCKRDCDWETVDRLLEPYCIEDDGPLDLFMYGQVYSDYGDLLARYDDQRLGYCRSINLEDKTHLDLILLNAKEISIDELIDMCRSVLAYYPNWTPHRTKKIYEDFE